MAKSPGASCGFIAATRGGRGKGLPPAAGVFFITSTGADVRKINGKYYLGAADSYEGRYFTKVGLPPVFVLVLEEAGTTSAGHPFMPKVVGTVDGVGNANTARISQMTVDLMYSELSFGRTNQALCRR
jgi:hypothetical protein